MFARCVKLDALLLGAHRRLAIRQPFEGYWEPRAQVALTVWLAPVNFLSNQQRAALTFADGKFRVSLYKALLYVGVADAIKSGALNLAYSEKYRALDEYLIPRLDWEAHRAQYLHRAQLEEFADCKATLQTMNRALDASYQETNQNLASGKNPYLTIHATGTFHVSTPKLDEVECLSLGTFFPDRKYISMLEMLATVNRATNVSMRVGGMDVALDDVVVHQPIVSLSVSSPSSEKGSLGRRPVMASTMRVCSRTGMARHSVQPDATSVNTREWTKVPTVFVPQ